MENFANSLRALCAEPLNQVSRELEDVKLELNAVKQRNAALEDRLERLEKSQQELQGQIQAQSDVADREHKAVQALRSSYRTLCAQNRSLLDKIQCGMNQNDVLTNGHALGYHRGLATQVQTPPPRKKSALLQPRQESEHSSSSTLVQVYDAQVEQTEQSSIHAESISHRNPAVTSAIIKGLDPPHKPPSVTPNTVPPDLLEPICAYSGTAGTEVPSPDPLQRSEDIAPSANMRKRNAPSNPTIVPPVRSERRRKVDHVKPTAAQSTANSMSQNSIDVLADQLPDGVNVFEDDDINDTIVVQHPNKREKSVSQLDGAESLAWTLMPDNDNNAQDVRKVTDSSSTKTASNTKTWIKQIQVPPKVPIDTMQTENNDQESYAQLRSKFRVRSGATQEALERTASLPTSVDETMIFNRGSRGRLRKAPAKTKKATGEYDV